MKRLIQKNRYFIIVSIIMIILIGISFFQFYEDQFSYVDDYNLIKENCYEEKDLEYDACKVFPNREALEIYIEGSDPVKKYETYDAITLTYNIVSRGLIATLQYLSPLLIALVVLGTVHSEFSSGMFENYLLQMDYKKYLKKTYKVVLKAALITPLTLLLIFFVASVLSGFDYTANYELTEFMQWKYNYYIIYGASVLLLQYIMNVIYGNIALYCCKKHKNKFVAIVMSFILFLVLDILVYIVIYGILFANVLGIKGLTDTFNIAGYWFFLSVKEWAFSFVVAFILLILSFVVLRRSYQNKEKVVLAYESQVS